MHTWFGGLIVAVLFHMQSFVVEAHNRDGLDYPELNMEDFADLSTTDQRVQREFKAVANSHDNFFLPKERHKLRPTMDIDSDEEDIDYYKGPILEHPYYQPKPTPPIFIPPDYSSRLGHHLFGDMPPSDTAKCFSCMSKFYEAVWPALKHVYKQPRNFTDNCNDKNIEQKIVPVTPCPTICIAMSEESTVAGVKIRGYIRGCLDDLLHNGFNKTIVAWYRWMHQDSCRIYRKRELFKLSTQESDESSIQVCTCYADYCNVAAAVSSNRLARMMLIFTCLTVLLFSRVKSISQLAITKRLA